MELSNEDIAETVEDIQNFFEESKVSRRDVLKICLVVEEALLRWQERFGEEHKFKIYMRKWFSAPKVVIRLADEPFNPFKDNVADDEAIFSNETIKNLPHYDEAKTIYRYENGYNELISFSTKERKPLIIPGGSIMVSVVLAIAFSFIVGFLPPDDIPEAFLKGNILQVTVLASLIGVCITLIGSQVTTVKKI